MTDWRATSLGEICKFQAGDAFPKELQGAATGDVPIVKVSDMNLSGNELFISYANNWLSRSAVARDFKLHPAGAVIFAKIGVALTSNRRRILIRPTVIDNNMMSAVCTSGIDPRWFYYLLTTLDFNEVASGSALPYLTVRDLNRIAVSLPSLPEQRAIAATLGALDDKIELNRRMNATLEAMARALFRDWFVDFGPTRAKQAGEPPTLAPELWLLFPARLDENGRPEGWELRRVDQLMELAYGKALKATDRQPGPVPVYGSGGITGQHSEALVPGPSVIIGRKGTVGSLYWEDRPFFPIDTVFYVRPLVPLTFCYYALDTLNLDRMNTDAAVPGLNRNNAYRLEVPWPSDDLVDVFDQLASSIRNRIRHSDEESRTLAQTRDLLLPRLMSGELRVAEAERLASEVA